MQWSKDTLNGAAPSKCIRMEKDSRAASVKLQMEVVNSRLRRWVEALVRGKGLPCLQMHVGSITKVLQPPLDVLSQKLCQIPFSGTNSVVQTNALLLLHGALALNTLDIRGLLTISRTFRASGHCVWVGAFSRSDCLLLTFRGSEGSSDVDLCTI